MILFLSLSLYLISPSFFELMGIINLICIFGRMYLKYVLLL